MTLNVEIYLQGCISAGCAIAGLFFLRYWKATRDRLFMLFALAFFTLALNRLLMAVFAQFQEHSYHLYLVRLAAFLLIIAAIVDKNLQRASGPSAPVAPPGSPKP